MTFPTFEEGYFQITALSFTPSVVAIGETAKMSITIKNISGKNITKCYVNQDGRYSSKSDGHYDGYFPKQFLYGGGGSSGFDLKSISWNNNVSLTFTATVPFTSSLSNLNHVFNSETAYIHVGIVTNVMFSDTGNYDNVYIKPDGNYLRILGYRLSPRILAMDFGRVTAEGTEADDGQYLQCKALKIAKNSQAVLGDFTKATITCTGSDGSSRSVKLTQAQLTAALTSGGYSETKPSIFANFVSALGVDYTLTLTLGDNYDQVKFTDTVMRSFARLHLSGGKNGGVAVGMFSSATVDKPKFEVADTHESFFYGGVKSFGAGDKCTESQRALGLQCGSYSLTVGAASTADVSITFPKAFAAVPTVLAHYTRTFDNVNHIGDEGVVCISATATQGKFRLCNASATSRTMTFNWFAIGQMSGAAVASFAAEPPKIVAEGICVDEALARTDYIAMMAGIEIPSDAEEELTVQSSPQQIESPSIDEPQSLHSEKFELVKLYYDAQVWNKSMVKVAVDKWITEDEYKEIINTK